jgi:transcriptional regulator with XRE-family HTH domain
LRAPSYADPDQRRAFASWLDGRRAEKGVSKTALAEAVGSEGTSRISGFLNGKQMPLPDTLRQICEVLDIPWFEAFAIAGYYRQLLVLLSELVILAEKWGEEDGIAPAIDDFRFRYRGVIQVGETPILEAIQNPDVAKRFVVGPYKDSDREICSVVPKPLAVALFVGATGFARRGDIYKDGRSGYAAEVLMAAKDIVALADGLNVDKKLPPLLESADAILRNRTVPLEYRRIPSAEYIVQWCDQICQGFTHYVRLAAFEYWGEAGSSLSTVTAWIQLPQLRKAECPDLSEFAL